VYTRKHTTLHIKKYLADELLQPADLGTGAPEGS